MYAPDLLAGDLAATVRRLRFCRMRGGGWMERILRYKTTALMLANIHGSCSECGWGGQAETHHWIDPVEDTIMMIMTQLIPAAAYARAPTCTARSTRPSVGD